MTGQQTPHHIAHSAEPTRFTYLLRRTAVGLVVSTMAVLGFMTTGGFSPPSTSAIESNDALGRGVQVGPGAAESPDPQPSDRPASEVTSPVVDPGSTTSIGPAAPPAPPQPAAVEPQSPPRRASRLVGQAPERLLDTRAGELPPAGSIHRIPVPADRTAVALSVSLIGSTQPGTVIVDGRAGPVTALEVGKSAVSSTNLVIVPVVGSEVTVRSSAGGHMTVDMLGSFASSSASAGGRFTSVDPTRIIRLETAIDGREAGFEFRDAVPDDAIAVLAVIDADVGVDGGMVRLGPAAGDFDQMLMWGPADGGNARRRGVVLIRPSELGSGYLRYDGGTLLTLDVIGYFTGDGAELTTAGLYVPSGPRRLFSGTLEPESPVEVGAVEPASDRALVTFGSPQAPGRGGTFVVPVAGGIVTLGTDEVRQVDVSLLGVFIDR